MFHWWSKDAKALPAVGSPQDLQALLARELFILFKHSSACPVSWSAYEEITRFRDEQPGVPVYSISVQRDRALSLYAAERTGVPHASPQLIVCRRGDVVAVASHGEITADLLASLLAEQPE